MSLTHGGDLVGFREKYGSEPLDFSVNINPLGLAPSVSKVLHSTADCPYPDPLYRELRRAISAYENIPDDWIICGNGASDLIWRIVLALKPKKALVTAPTFAGYEEALRFLRCRTNHHTLSLRDGFHLTETILSSIDVGTDMLFLCTPNNPTGLTVHPDLLQRILERCMACGTWLVLDECFLDFLPDAETRSGKRFLSKYTNLIVLNAFTKIFGMAGLRLGYGICSDPEARKSLWGAGQCWPVSSIAAQAGIAALQDRDYLRRTLSFLPQERERVRTLLETLGFQVFPGEANFLMFYTKIPDFAEKVSRRGILLRDCSNYSGLTRGYFRTAILTEEKNNRLLQALAGIGGE